CNAVSADPGRRDLSSREVRIVCKDGTPRDVLASVAAVDDLLLTTFVDLTARKRAEADVRARQLELAEAQRIAHVGSWTQDLATDTVEWSQETYRIFGFWPGRPPASFEELRNLLDADSFARVAAGVERCAATGAPYQEALVLRRQDGEIRHVIARGERATGEPVRLRGTFSDVTDLRRIEEALRAPTSVGMLKINGNEVIREKAPDDLDAYLAMGRAFETMERTDEAMMAYQRLLGSQLLALYGVNKLLRRHTGEDRQRQLWPDAVGFNQLFEQGAFLLVIKTIEQLRIFANDKMGKNDGLVAHIRQFIKTGHWHMYFIAHASRFQ
ncbi:MAG: hypothetical protein EOM69_11670, partial [Clostridia bacterium]|nr:hypothetical protein [Clostridia bacterium]